MNQRNWIFYVTLLVVFGMLWGCADEQVEGDIDPDSMQARADEMLSKENRPGKVYFEQACGACHNGAVKKAPHRDMLGLMTPEAIFGTLNTGVMQQEAQNLSQSEKIAVAEYLAGADFGAAQLDVPMCLEGEGFQPDLAAQVAHWGMQPTNQRQISARSAGIEPADWGRLKPKWAVKFPGANRVRSQPTMAGGLIFVGSHSGRVYALDAGSGCQVWSFAASGEVRTGIVVASADTAADVSHVFFGDVLGNVYGLQAHSGELVWRIRADDHPNATITATPALHQGTLFIPVSALEVSLAIDPTYACCTFRGSILAVEAGSGKTLWRTYTIDQVATQQSLNASGTPMMGPSGAVVWNTPSVDAKRGQIYFGTGENMSSPATLTSDALFALDMQTGKVNWTFQATANDAWNVACDTQTPDSCPVENGPDYDFGGPTILVRSSQHGDLVVAGQKSGFVHAIAPETGALVWQTQVGRGGIQGGIHFGMAAAGERLFVPISDMADGRSYPFPDRPGMLALDLNTGTLLWSTLHEDQCLGRAFCHPGISQVPTVVGDVVVAGAMDGWVRAYDKVNGDVVWSLDTTKAYTTNTAEEARGGSLGGAAGPVAGAGTVLISSGYGIYNHMPGNLLLALALD